MTPSKIAGGFVACVLFLYIGFAVGLRSVPDAAVAPTTTQGVNKSKGNLEPMTDIPMASLEERKASMSNNTAMQIGGAKIPSVAEILSHSRGYRAAGGGHDVELLWHAQSPKAIMAWGYEMSIYPFKQWPAKNPEVLILRSTEGSGTITQQTLYSFIRLSEKEWELRAVSVIVGGNEVVMTFDTRNYAAYAKSRGGELLSVISFVGYNPTPEEQAERRKSDKNAIKGIEIK